MTVLTHPGRSHRDEFLSVSILLAAYPVVSKVVRQEPSADHLATPEVIVVDVGGRHEPKLMNFDHHQFPVGTPVCSITLVLNHLDLLEIAREAWAWLTFSEVLDTGGLSAAAEIVGATGDMRPSLSPVEQFMLGRFASVVELEPNDPLWVWMQMLGQDLLDELKMFHQRQATLARQTQVFQFGIHQGLLNNIPKDQDPEKGFNLFVDKHHPRAAVLVVEDPRGAGWRLFRREEFQGRIDLSRLAEHPEMNFVHPAGWLASTKWRLSAEALVELLEKAVVATP